ncbi:MAG: hypothetical protein FJ026_04475, partial [Chloroflexi bacterium]|nr:hypothetical protein [Chloroflexota bacterium]
MRPLAEQRPLRCATGTLRSRRFSWHSLCSTLLAVVVVAVVGVLPFAASRPARSGAAAPNTVSARYAGDGAASRASTQDVIVRLDPSSPTVSKDQFFTIDIQVVAGTQPIDGAEAHLDFDPVYLQVVDANGNPATTIVSSGVLNIPILNTVNNAQGTIAFAAGTFDPTPPTGTFVLATIRFR